MSASMRPSLFSDGDVQDRACSRREASSCFNAAVALQRRRSSPSAPARRCSSSFNAAVALQRRRWRPLLRAARRSSFALRTCGRRSSATEMPITESVCEWHLALQCGRRSSATEMWGLRRYPCRWWCFNAAVALRRRRTFIATGGKLCASSTVMSASMGPSLIATEIRASGTRTEVPLPQWASIAAVALLRDQEIANEHPGSYGARSRFKLCSRRSSATEIPELHAVVCGALTQLQCGRRSSATEITRAAFFADVAASRTLQCGRRSSATEIIFGVVWGGGLFPVLQCGRRSSATEIGPSLGVERHPRAIRFNAAVALQRRRCVVKKRKPLSVDVASMRPSLFSDGDAGIADHRALVRAGFN